MRKLFLSLIAVAGFIGFAGVAQAECYGSHTTTASTDSSTVVTTGTSKPVVTEQSDG